MAGPVARTEKAGRTNKTVYFGSETAALIAAFNTAILPRESLNDDEIPVEHLNLEEAVFQLCQTAPGGVSGELDFSIDDQALICRLMKQYCADISEKIGVRVQAAYVSSKRTGHHRTMEVVSISKQGYRKCFKVWIDLWLPESARAPESEYYVYFSSIEHKT